MPRRRSDSVLTIRLAPYCGAERTINDLPDAVPNSGVCDLGPLVRHAHRCAANAIWEWHRLTPLSLDFVERSTGRSGWRACLPDDSADFVAEIERVARIRFEPEI